MTSCAPVPVALRIPPLPSLARPEAELWESADQLRANSRLNATEYRMPVLGLIFLRHATNRFDAVRRDVEAALPTCGGVRRPLAKDDFRGRAAIDEAMRLVEAEVPA